MRSLTTPALIRAMTLLAFAAVACHRENTYEDYPLDHWYTALRDTSGRIRAQAAEIIARGAPEHPETVRRLLDALATESDSSVHVILAGALGEVVQRSGNTNDVVLALVPLTRDSHESVRTASVFALSRAIAASNRNSPPPPAAIASLKAALQADDHDMRIVGAEAIGRIALVHPQWTASFAEPLAAAIQRDHVTYVRQRSLDAFIHVPSPDSLRIVTYRSALHDDWPDMTKTALRGVALSGTAAAVLADSIVHLLESDDSETRALTANAMASAGPAAARPTILAGLSRAISDRDSTVRDAAKMALLRIKGPTR